MEKYTLSEAMVKSSAHKKIIRITEIAKESGYGGQS